MRGTKPDKRDNQTIFQGSIDKHIDHFELRRLSLMCLASLFWWKCSPVFLSHDVKPDRVDSDRAPQLKVQSIFGDAASVLRHGPDPLDQKPGDTTTVAPLKSGLTSEVQIARDPTLTSSSFPKKSAPLHPRVQHDKASGGQCMMRCCRVTWSVSHRATVLAFDHRQTTNH